VLNNRFIALRDNFFRFKYVSSRLYILINLFLHEFDGLFVPTLIFIHLILELLQQIIHLLISHILLGISYFFLQALYLTVIAARRVALEEG
jgi:hypothetical protein